MSDLLNEYRISYREIYGRELYIYAKSEEDAIKIFERMQEKVTLVGHDDFISSYTATSAVDSSELSGQELKTKMTIDGCSIVARYSEADKLLQDESIAPITGNFED